jgi:hypothetical protein
MNSATTGRAGPTVECIAYHSRAGGPERTGITPSTPDSSSCATASRETNETPSPARAACLIAPFDPRVRV